jgi:uncharacterized protein YecT (DUF1311 family)
MLARIVWGLCLLSPMAASAKSGVCDNPVNNVAEMECMSAEIGKAEAKLERYLATAKKRVARDDTIRLNLDTAQNAWQAYRKAQCGDVYDYWGMASYRHRASAQCTLELTRQRTLDIWSAYLTFVDSTPPVLPKP